MTATTHGQNNYIALDPIANGYSGGGGALAVCLDYRDLWIRNDITANCTMYIYKPCITKPFYFIKLFFAHVSLYSLVKKYRT